VAWIRHEERSYRTLFLVLSLLLAVVSVWAVYDEVVTRRPWKDWQAQWQDHVDESGSIVVSQLNLPDLGALDRCMSCHVGIDDPRGDDETLPEPLRIHPRHEGLLGDHPPERFGCTSCHLGQGVALTAESAHAVDDPHWPEPMRVGRFVESGCLSCHRGEVELAGAPLLSEGRRLFQESGCGGCHATNGEPQQRRGPSLRHVAAKMHPAALAEWIRDPQPRRTGLVMPQFWPDDPARAAEESVAIAAWLLSVSEPYPTEAIEVDVNPVRVAAGQRLFDRVGCRGCHALGDPALDEVVLGASEQTEADDAWAAFGGGFDDPFGSGAAEEPEPEPPIAHGPPLGGAGARVRLPFLVAWLQDPSSYDPEARMPDMRLTDDEASALAAWLVSLGGARPATPESLRAPYDPDLLERGRELVSLYGCYGCHDIPGFEEAGRPGPDLSDYGRKERRELFFGQADVPLEAQDWESYSRFKLATPRAFVSDDIVPVMPQFDLSPEQIDALTIYLRGLVDVPPAPGFVHEPPESEELRLGLRLIEERNCTGCHTLGDQTGDILRHYADVNLGPPELTAEGRRVRPDWLFNFLLTPTTLRPWLDLRMPDFGLTEEEAAALATTFAELAEVPTPYRRLAHRPITAERAELGAWLFGELKCVSCHQLSGGEAMAAGELAPDLGLARQRLDPAWVRSFLIDPSVDLPGTRMPQFFAGGQTAYPEVLDGDVDAQLDLLVDHLMNLGLQPQGALLPEGGS